VSMPSMELFRQQPASYRNQVLPSSVTAKVAVEAGVTEPWLSLVGSSGAVVGVDRFGASAPYRDIYEHFGLTDTAVAKRARELLA